MDDGVRDSGATAVEYGLLTLVAATVAGAVYLFTPVLDFGLPEFAKFRLGQGGDGGGSGGTGGVVAGSGATLAGAVSGRPGQDPVTCPDFAEPTSGTVVTCTDDATSAPVVVRFNSDDPDDFDIVS